MTTGTGEWMRGTRRGLALLILASGCSPVALEPHSLDAAKEAGRAPPSTEVSLPAPAVTVSREDAEADIGSCMAGLRAPVVSVAVQFPGHAVYGNGVLVSHQDGVASVMTCAHVVQGHVSPSAVLVRLFPHNFVEPCREMFEAPSFDARVVAIDVDRDLALLHMSSDLPLTAVSLHEQEETPDVPYTIVSTTPEGDLLVEDWFRPVFEQGQSGSPVYQRNGLVGIANRIYGPPGLPFGTGAWVSFEEIQDFLSSHVTD